MATKLKTITLIPGYTLADEPAGSATGYRVERVTDTIEHTPGDLISRATASQLCNSKSWKVTIKTGGN